MDADGRERRFLIEGGSPRWSPDGRRLAYLAPDGIWVVDRDGSDAHRVSTGSVGYNELDWSPDGRRFATVGTPGDHHSFVYVVDAVDGSRERVPGTKGALNVAWSPSGRRLAVAGFLRDSFRSLIWIVRPDGSGLRAITDGGNTGDNDPTWSPDGRWLAFARGGPSVYLVRRDGSDLHRLLRRASGPDWRPG
jgi:Tol biopolymer transport system component